jgi:hypothetical protein
LLISRVEALLKSESNNLNRTTTSNTINYFWTKWNKQHILAYSRTESSLTGDILSTSSDTTYLFEPLINLKLKDKYLNTDAIAKGKIQEVIEDIYNCREVIKKSGN